MAVFPSKLVKVAVIAVVQGGLDAEQETAVASPEGLMVATLVSADPHLTCAVTSSVSGLALNVPMATN
ncbi:MAG TPA: hypothetical protein VHV29_06555 [Terriglobales bacterium]|nr:hypothetical protein [Terriglobales bacterium]